jgi:hypothetical protein
MKTATPRSAAAPVGAAASRAPGAPQASRKAASRAAPAPAPKAAARPASRRAADAAGPVKVAAEAMAVAAAPAVADKPPKTLKLRLVRDSFTMPESDFALVSVLKARALGLGRAAKKSELLRAGLQLLSQQDAPGLVAALERLQPIKTGRPKRVD